METTVLRPSGGSGDPDIDGILRRKFLACAASAGIAAEDAKARLAALETVYSTEDAIAAIARATSARDKHTLEAVC